MNIYGDAATEDMRQGPTTSISCFAARLVPSHNGTPDDFRSARPSIMVVTLLLGCRPGERFGTAISELKSERLHWRPSAKGGRKFQFQLGPFEQADSRVVPERRTNMSLTLRPVNTLSLG